MYISNSRPELVNPIADKHYLPIQNINANNLNVFVINNSKNLTHATHLIIDLSAINDTHDEIINAVNMLNKLYSQMRIIALADNDKISVELLRRMYDKGVYDIVKDLDNELEKSILKGKSAEEAKEFFVERPNLSDEKNQKELEAKILKNESILKEKELQTINQEERQKIVENILPNKDFRKYKPYINVAICGTESHVGTTHNALLITKFLTDIGFKTCYLEANQNQKIFYLQSFYPQNSNYSVQKSLLKCFGIDIFSGFSISNVMAYKYDFYIFDLGVLTEEKLTSFMTKDIKIIVSGSKAWELIELRKTMELVSEKNIVYYLLNYFTKGEESKLLNFMGNLKNLTFFAEYAESPFKGGVNVDIYKKIFEEYLIFEEKKENPITKKKRFFKFQ